MAAGGFPVPGAMVTRRRGPGKTSDKEAAGGAGPGKKGVCPRPAIMDDRRDRPVSSARFPRAKGSMRNVLVIRFGALGDLCLLARTLARATALPGERRVTLVTKAAFAPLLAEARGVDEVVPLPPGGAGNLWELARTLNRRPWDAVVDAHGVLRSRLLSLLMGRRPDARLAKDTSARLRLLAGRGGDPALARTMRDRFDELLPALSGTADPPPGEVPVFPCLAEVQVEPDLLGLAPGAHWATKRWPTERFAEVLGRHAAAGGRTRIFLGPQEGAWWDGSPLAIAALDSGAEVLHDLPLVEVARGLSACGAVLTNDSGLLHLAEAVGRPVVALFGPTVRDFGYFPGRPDSVVLETDLDCRPCSRNGKRPCHRGDLACLERIPVEQALGALAPLLGTVPDTEAGP